MRNARNPRSGTLALEAPCPGADAAPPGLRLDRRGFLAPLATALLALLFLTGAVADAFAQTGYVPYFGKNRIRYDNFKWNIYTTDHFEIYYYPEIEQHLERVTSYAESAYQQVSSDLKHDLAFKVPLVLYKTEAEFQQQNIEPGELPEGVLAFAEPYRDRMVLPIDEPSDALYRLITHELTHIFEFDIIPRSLLRRGLPLWVDEGLSDYMTGYWQPFDLMTVRDAAIADIVPSMSDFEGVQFADGRLPYNLGHAAFEFIESKWGKEGLRQFLFALRKNVIGGGDSAYEEAFRLKPEEFDEQFDAMFSYKAKNYALLTRSGDVIIKGGALKSRGLEKFQRVFLEEMIRMIMQGKPEAIADFRNDFEQKIRNREWKIDMLMKTDTLQDSLDKYRTKIASSARNRAAAYELALASGRNYRPGDQIATTSRLRRRRSQHTKLPD